MLCLTQCCLKKRFPVLHLFFWKQKKKPVMKTEWYILFAEHISFSRKRNVSYTVVYG